MASPVIDFNGISFTNGEISDLKEVFYTSVFNNPEINRLHRIVPGVKSRMQVAILGLMGLVGKTMTTEQCAPDVSDEEIPMSEKFWDPTYIEDRFVYCFKDLLGKWTVWMLKNGVEKWDIEFWALFIEDQITLSLRDAIFRISYFSNRAMANVSAGGTLKNGVNVRFFNAINGFWTQIFGGVTAGKIEKIDIANNAGADYAAQGFTAQDTTDQTVTKIFQEMVEAADERLIEDAGLRFYVTKSLYDQYKRERKNFPYIDSAYDRTEAGILTLSYDGIPVEKIGIQDRMIKAYFNNGIKYSFPHRAFLSTPENMQIGTEEESNFTELDSFPDKKSKEWITDVGFNIDAMLVEEHKVVAAY